MLPRTQKRSGKEHEVEFGTVSPSPDALGGLMEAHDLEGGENAPPTEKMVALQNMGAVDPKP